MTYIRIDHKQINITHGEKLLFPEAGLTKMDLINYYINIADYILPLIKDRPLTINCFPQGINENGYYRQNAPKEYPSWIATIKLKKKDGSYMNHILCQDKASLIYIVNHNTIAIHRWLSHCTNPNYPDIGLIDIDPPEDRFDLACKGAKLLRAESKKFEYESFVMTTGSSGIHVLLPIKNNLTFEEVKIRLSKIVHNVIDEYPNEFTTTINKEKRAGRVYFDLLRNSYGQTAIAPYSLRANKQAAIATPLNWDELEDPNFCSKKYTVHNIFTRLQNLPSDLLDSNF